ncbi:MAG: hypothetical protein AAF492_32685, partial [Verrucomicrobiota bacterium]
SQGTHPSIMIDALKRAGAKLGCKIRTLDDFKMSDFEKMISRYNKEAKKADKPQINLQGIVIDLGYVFHVMDTEILKAVRQKSRGDYQGFLKDVQNYVLAGNPLAWSVFVGKVPETPRVRGFGGHMRLIIGYNSRTSELIYSDTWGRGHEIKRMPMSDAWAITTGLYLIEPRYKTR